MYRRLSYLFLLAALLLSLGLSGPARVTAAPSIQPLARSAVFVDTDTGVDDALALALLLRAPTANLVGISTVVGNTSVDNATKNVLTVLDVAGRTVPVTVGAATPRAWARRMAGTAARSQRPTHLATRRRSTSSSKLISS